MAAYAALVSVMQIIDQLEHHPSPPISIDKQQLESLTEIVTSLQEFLEGYNSPVSYSDEADPLEMRIADAAYAAEDVIESFIVDTIELRRSTSTLDQEISSSSGKRINSSSGRGISSGEEIRRWNNFYQNVQKRIEEMDSIKKVVMETMREKSITTANQAHQPQRNMSFTEKNNSLMVGFDDVLLQLLDRLTSGPLYRQVIPITGMGGIGKTTLARNVFQHALIKEYFHICAWVTISQQYSTKEIISEILDQVTGKKSEKSNKSEEELVQELYKFLLGRRYLIIMDDIWSIDVWEKLKFILGDSNNGSRIIVTTRQSYLISQLTEYFCLDMKFLDEVNSWNLFYKTVFGEERFPFQLETIGRAIVKVCRGLPLSIVVIGGLLAKSEHTEEYWKYIEQKLNSIVNAENDEYCLKILKMSYNHLPAYLKPCFLYMGIFEEDTKILVSTLIKLWVSEGFLQSENGKSLETIGKEFLKDLIDRSLILIDGLVCTGDIKFCKMHDLLRDLCLKEAEKEKFYHVMGQHTPQGIHDQRRVFWPRRTSIGALKSMSHVRSVTCHSYGVGVGLPNFRLLRILNAAYDRYGEIHSKYRLKDVIHELVNSRYLSITSTTTHWKSEKLPAAVNFLWNLQTLQISGYNRNISIIAPIEIWKMSQLRHVKVRHGTMYLPDPPSDDIDIVILENLQTLRGLWNFKFGEEVVERIPNIKRLKIIYDVGTGRCDRGDYYSLHNLKCLRQLESLTCNTMATNGVILNRVTFPHSLRKLSVEGFLIGWEDMLEKIGSIPLLQKLKLAFGYFRTCKWETVEGQFPSLKSLTLDHCDHFEHWIIEDSSHFPCLEHLCLKKILQLEEIPLEIGEIPTLQSIQLIDCSDSAIKSARKIVEEQEEFQGEQLPFHVEVTIYDSKKKEALQTLANPNFNVH